MNILLNTHFIIWLASDPAGLTEHERDVLSNDTNRIIASAISIWEIRLKWASAYASGERKGIVDPIEALALDNSAGMSLLDA